MSDPLVPIVVRECDATGTITERTVMSETVAPDPRDVRMQAIADRVNTLSSRLGIGGILSQDK